MHATSSRHPHHLFQQQHQSPTPPPPSSPYPSYPSNNNISTVSVASHNTQYTCPDPYAPYLVAHQGQGSHSGSRSRSPNLPTSASSHNMPRSSSPAPPSASSHGHARDAVALGPSSTTPHPPEDVVMTSKIEFTRDTRDRPIINQYLIGHRLGNGQHGEVYKGYDMRRGNMLVAIKVCRRKNTKEAKYEQLRQRNQGAIPRTVGGFGGVSTRPRLVDQLQSTEKKVLREIAIMKKCKHGQIVQLYEVINDRLTSKIFLVLEYMGGGEVKWRDEQGRPCLRVDQTRRICRDVVLGLLYLHHQGIIHRDIKPANLLWTSDRMNVKITDFGVSHFSAAQRIDALKRSSAYREALERRKEARRRREEESSGNATPVRRKTGGWRGRGSVTASKEDVKGKGRARDDPPPPSSAFKSDLSSPASDHEDAEIEAELLKEFAGDVDPILLDDGGLSRQAGTPSFLAPEIIWEFGEKQTAALYRKVGLKRGRRERGECENEYDGLREFLDSRGRDGSDMDKAPASLTTTLKTPHRPIPLEDEATPHAADAADQNSLDLPSEATPTHLRETYSTMPDPDPNSVNDYNAIIAAGELDPETDAELPPRPPITKAIDVWALGVTLYCLLFGRTPWGGNTEFAMYQMIHTEDFVVDTFMGYDRIPTGGRFHDEDDTSEGAIVIGLLDRLLEKECSKRITLEEVKRLPWITRDIPNPDEWVAETSPDLHDPIRITSADEDVAMSTVKFRWKFDMSKPFRRFRSLLPAGRSAAARQQQTQRRADAREFDVELDTMLLRSLQIESESERSEREASVARRRLAGSEATGLQRKPSRSRRVVDAVERGVKKISRHGSSIHQANTPGGETPRSMKRRTLPDLMLGTRGRSMSRSRDGSISRPSSRASGPATPRVASGGSYSNLTSPSTAGFTSDAETDILDEADVRAVQTHRRKERKEWDRERRQKAFSRQSLSNLSKMLGLKPRGSPRASASEIGSKASPGAVWKSFSKSPASPASPAGGSGSGGSGPTSARTSFATQRLTRRSADEFGAARIGLASSNAARGGPSSMGGRSDSGPAIGGSAGVATSGRGFALASADELTSAMRASSWGDVADEYGDDYGYGGNARGEYDDADGVSDYGFGSGSANGDYALYGNGNSRAYASGDICGYPDDDDVVRLVGAGGILSHPVSGPSSPNSLSGVSIGTGLGVPPDSLSLPGVMAEVVPPTPGSSGAQVAVPASAGSTLPLLQTQFQDPGRRRGASVGSRHTHHHHYPHVISSPLAQTPLNVDRDEPFEFALNEDSGDVHVSRNTSSVDNTRRNTNATDDSSVSGVRIFGQGSTSLKVDDEVPDIDVFEEDDSGSEEDGQLIVRRRRPSEHLAHSQSGVRPESTQPPNPGVEDDVEIC